jgi:hypothetical protein
MPGPRDMLGYMRTLGRGTPVDRPWPVVAQVATMMRAGRGLAVKGSPLTLQDVMSDPGYRDLRTPKVAVGDVAPDFELSRVDGSGTVRLSELNAGGSVALVFGSYT